MAWNIRYVTVAATCCYYVMCVLVLVQSQDVRRPPVITKGPSGQYVTKMGGTPVEIPCEASGSPAPAEFQWYRNGARLDLNNQKIYRPDPTKGTIWITEPSTFEEGYYQCTARNDWGTARSDVGQVIMATLGGYPAPTVKSLKVDEGSFQMLVCDPTKVSPNATYSWGVTSSTTDPTVVTVAASERISMDNTGNLYFGYVVQSDWRNGQIYKCQVKNPWLDQMVGGSYVTLAVTPVSGTTVKPLLRYSTRSVVGLKGREADMRCIFSGRESPSIQWKRADGFGTLPVGRFEALQYNTNLRIRDLAVVDKGSYECVASNSAGTAHETVYLDVKVIPEFVNAGDGPKDMNVTDGDDAVIHCKSYADPVATVVWFINGYSFQANNRRRVSHDGLTLTLVDVCRSCSDGSSDLMVVSCNASNAHGYAYASGYINVLKKTSITESPVDTTMEFPYDVNMTCRGVSDPSTPVSVEWYDHHGNRIYNQSDHFEITQDARGGSRLRIIVAHDDDDLGASRAGMYTCVVSNGVSKESRNAHVLKPSEKETVVASASILDNWWILLIILAVVLLLLILLLVCFVCLRNKGDVYKVDESEVRNGNNPRQELLDTGYKGYMRTEPEGPLRGSRASLGSQMSLNSETSLAEYEADYGKFNEEGSFIGAYKGDQRTPAHATNV